MNLTPAMMRAIARPSAANDARIHKATVKENLTVEGVEKESDLHNQIIEECKKRQWICLHGSMAQATARPLGEWDFTILANRGYVYFIECKTATGKLTPEQQGMILWAKTMGHMVYVCRSFKQFIEIVDQPRTI